MTEASSEQVGLGLKRVADVEAIPVPGIQIAEWNGDDINTVLYKFCLLLAY